MSLKKIKNIIGGLNESSIDFPHEKPSEDVWLFKDSGDYVLRKDVKNKIFRALRAYPYYNLIELVRDIYIIGSITSNIYDDESDIDIHIIPNVDQIENYQLKNILENSNLSEDLKCRLGMLLELTGN